MLARAIRAAATSRGAATVAHAATTIGIAPAPPHLEREWYEYFTSSATALVLKEEMPPIPNDRPLTPAEISAYVQAAPNIHALVIPGSHRPIDPNFINPHPTAVSFQTFNYSRIRMELLRRAVEEGKPVIASCDGANYPTTLLGGRIAPVTKIPPSFNQPKISHNNNWSGDPKKLEEKPQHDVKVLPGTWLHTAAARLTNQCSPDGGIVFPEAYSTHPYYPCPLPPLAKLLATAPDGTPSIYTVFDYVLAMYDHIETPSRTHEEGYRPDGVVYPPDLAHAIKRTFIACAQDYQARGSLYKPPKDAFNPHTMDVLTRPSTQLFDVRGNVLTPKTKAPMH